MFKWKLLIIVVTQGGFSRLKAAVTESGTGISKQALFSIQAVGKACLDIRMMR